MSLFINDLLVDIDRNLPFPLSFEINDIRNLSQRKSASSKTVVLPGTQKNNQIMSSIFVQSVATPQDGGQFKQFDPTVKATAKYYKDDVLQFTGICQLNECVKVNGEWQFHINLYSETIDYLQVFKTFKLRELGWSEYDHILNRQNQVDSWSGTIQKNAAPYNNFTGSEWNGEGYYYGLIDYGYDRPADDTFTVEQILPQVFVKEIIDKLFAKAEVSYNSTFFESEQFKRLLLAFEGGVLPTVDATTATNNSVLVSHINWTSGTLEDYTIPMQQSLGGNPLSWFNIVQVNAYWFNTDAGTATDPGGLVQTFYPFKEVAALDGSYKLTYSGTHDVNMNFIVTGAPGGTTYQVFATTFTMYLDIYINNSVAKTVTLWQNSVESTSLTNSFSANFSFQQDLQLDTSDELKLALRFRRTYTSFRTSNPVGNVELNVDCTLNGCQAAIDMQQVSIIAGGNVNIGQFLPDMDGATFFKGIADAFYLNIQPNVDDVSILDIEPFSDFYEDDTTADDWTDLIDYDKDLKITPSVNLGTKEYIYKFVDDLDYWNERYLRDTEDQYGSKTVLNTSQLAVGTTKTELPFSNKLLVKIDNTDLVVPRNYQVKGNSGLTTEIVERKGKAFLVQIKKGAPGTMQTANWYHVDETDTANLETSYPYVGHLDNINSPTFDLMFGLPSYVFYEFLSGQNYTTNNLYSYHEQFLKEILDRNGKMLTCSVRLNADLINRLNFRKRKHIDGVPYRLQKVIEYNAENDESTVCEFIRIIDTDSIQKYTITKPTDLYLEPLLKFQRITEDGEQRITEDGENRRI